MTTLADIKYIQFPGNQKEDACLVVYEKQVPFDIKRVFNVHAQTPTTRGKHAHKVCQQLLVPIAGEIEVTCDDGQQRTDFLLNDPRQGLLIPAGIWAEQRYLTTPCSLMVLCDQLYDESDYLRDYADFLSFADSTRFPASQSLPGI